MITTTAAMMTTDINNTVVWMREWITAPASPPSPSRISVTALAKKMVVFDVGVLDAVIIVVIQKVVGQNLLRSGFDCLVGVVADW